MPTKKQVTLKFDENDLIMFGVSAFSDGKKNTVKVFDKDSSPFEVHFFIKLVKALGYKIVKYEEYHHDLFVDVDCHYFINIPFDKYLKLEHEKIDYPIEYFEMTKPKKKTAKKKTTKKVKGKKS